MKTLMYCLALAGMAVFTSPAFAQAPTLTSVEAKFDTTTDGKNPDTKLDVYVKNSSGQEVAKSEGNEGQWDKHSSHTLILQVEGNPAKAEVASGSLALTFRPHGSDDWKFNYTVTLKFSDDSSIIKIIEGCQLTQYNTARSDSL